MAGRDNSDNFLSGILDSPELRASSMPSHNTISSKTGSTAAAADCKRLPSSSVKLTSAGAASSPCTSSEGDIQVVLTISVAVSSTDTPTTLVQKARQATAAALSTPTGPTTVWRTKTLDPTVPLVAAGVGSGDIVALSDTTQSRCGSSGDCETEFTSYSEDQAEAGQGHVDELTLQHLVALKEAIGPKFIAVEDTRTQVEVRSRLLANIRSRIDSGQFVAEQSDTVNFTSRMASDLETLKAALERRRVEFDRAVNAYRRMARREIRRTSILMQRKSSDYNEVVANQERSAVDSLTVAVEGVANVGPLAPGDQVQVVHGGAFTPAIVVEQEHGGDPDAPPMFRIRLRTQQLTITFEYSEDFLEEVVLPRSLIYRPPPRVRQPQPSEIAVALAKLRGREEAPCTEDVEYLAELMTTAAKVAPRFEASIQCAMSAAQLMERVIVHKSSLKKIARTTQKASVKYKGDYSCILDIVRLTVVCQSLDAVAAAFQAVVHAIGFKLARVKNRLHPSFDATSSAGYRDVLLNVVDETTGHVCEVQLTLQGFMTAKENGGHAVYKVLRLVGRLEEWSSTHQGDAGDVEAAERLRDGALTSFDITGSTHSGILSHVVPALASSRCFLSSLKLNFVSGLKSLAEQVLTESVLKQLAPTLQVLEAHNCGSHGLVPPGLRQCRQLRHLHLGLNRFDGGLPQWIGELDRLRHLDIEQCDLAGVIPPSIANLQLIQVLDLCGNRISGPLSEAVRSLHQVKALHLNLNMLTGPIPEWIGELAELRELSLRGNRLTGAIPQSLGNLVHLTELYLYDNALCGELPKELAACAHLTMLSCSSNSITGPIPSWIGQLSSLSGLYLHDNQFSGELPESMRQLRALSHLSISKNNLTGMLPEWFSEMTALAFVDVSENYFTGPLPITLSQLQKLSTFDAHSNGLEGLVPDSYGDFLSLQSLDLHNTSLRGPIPDSLNNLVRLHKLHFLI